jgi:PTH1 family peptidyl-tRNA hydrolase
LSSKEKKLVVGLGNPGARYKTTRHNIGFLVLEEGKILGTSLLFKKDRRLGCVANLETDELQVTFLLPQTYMNRSGAPVKRCLESLELDSNQLLVISDDLDLPLGKVRFRQKGSSGGHRGLESIQASLQTDNFRRLKLGIGRPEGRGETVDYVLEPFSKEEGLLAGNAIKNASIVVDEWLLGGDQAARDKLSGLDS